MYDYLVGRIAERAATRVVLEVSGVGYDVAVPLGVDFRREAAAESLFPEGGELVKVWTHLVVREDAHMLFGFPDQRMRELFRLLLKVRGVGPGLAQAILSSMTEAELLETIASEDSKPLTRIKGVGKKTADQILLDLRDRAPKPREVDGGVIVPAAPGAAEHARALDDAVQALVSIGYTDKQAKTSVERAAKKIGSDDLEALVRAALRQ